jgi:hypothetical protein
MADVAPLKIGSGRVQRTATGDELLVDGGYKVTSTKGLGAIFEKSQSSVNQSWPASVYTEVLATTPATGYQTIIPASWLVPARGAAGGSAVQGAIRFYFSDGSTVTRQNGSNTAVTETRDTVSFGKDGLTITSIGFGAVNTSGGGVTTTIGPWSLADGAQV